MRNKRYVLFFCLLGLLYASVEYSTDHHEVLTTTVVDRSFQDNASEVSGRIQASSIEYYDRDTHDMYRSTDICTRIDTPDRPDNMGRGDCYSSSIHSVEHIGHVVLDRSERSHALERNDWQNSSDSFGGAHSIDNGWVTRIADDKDVSSWRQPRAQDSQACFDGIRHDAGSPQGPNQPNDDWQDALVSHPGDQELVRKLLADERTAARFDEVKTFVEVPSKPYRTTSAILLFQESEQARTCPLFVDLYNQCSTLRQFKQRVRECAAAIRANDLLFRYPEWHINFKDYEHKILPFSKCYSDAQRLLFELEQELQDYNATDDERPVLAQGAGNLEWVPCIPYRGAPQLFTPLALGRNDAQVLQLYRAYSSYTLFKAAVAEKVAHNTANIAVYLLNKRIIEHDQRAAKDAAWHRSVSRSQLTASKEKAQRYCEWIELQELYHKKDGDKRSFIHGHPYSSVPYKLTYEFYVGYATPACLQHGERSDLYKACPLIAQLYKQSTTFAAFYAGIKSYAEAIRKDDRYLFNSVKNYGIKRKYPFGIIGSHDDYSLAQKIIFDVERDLEESIKKYNRRLITRECYRRDKQRVQKTIEWYDKQLEQLDAEEALEAAIELLPSDEVVLPSFDIANRQDELLQNYQSDFCDSALLTNYAETSLHRSLQLAERGYEGKFKNYLQERFVVLSQAALTPYELHANPYSFDELVAQYPEVSVLSHANVAQLRLYQELHDGLSVLRKIEGAGPVVAGNQAALQAFAAAALQQNLETAFSLAETVYHCAHALEIMVNKVSGIIGLGVYNAAHGYVAGLKSYFTNPIDAVLADIKAPIELASKAFTTAYTIAFGDEEERQALWQATRAIADGVIEHPDVVVTFAVLLFVPSARQALTRLGKHAVHNIAPLVRKSKQGKRLAEACAGNGAVLAPVKTVVHNGAEAVVKTYATLCEEVYATCKKVPFTQMSYKHIIYGELVGQLKLPSGFHTEWGCTVSRLIKGLILPPDKRGIYVGYYQRGKWAKFSTFFPKSLSPSEIKKLIEEAYQNPCLKRSSDIIGKTKCGMLIKICFVKQNGRIAVKTAYPLYNDLDDGIRLIQQLGKTKVAYII